MLNLCLLVVGILSAFYAFVGVEAGRNSGDVLIAIILAVLSVGLGVTLPMSKHNKQVGKLPIDRRWHNDPHYCARILHKMTYKG